MPPALPDPGPFSNAPDTLSLSGNEAAFVVPDIQPSELGTGGGTDSQDNNASGNAGANANSGTGTSGSSGSGATAGGATAGSGAASGNQSGVGLARTGASTPALATISVLLLSIGGVLMVASRRESEDI